MASRTLKPTDKDAKFYEDLRKANEDQSAKGLKKPPAEPAPTSEDDQ